MVAVEIFFVGRASVTFSAVRKIQYFSGGVSYTYEGDDIVRHAIPIGNSLWLYTDDGLAVVDTKDAYVIDITMQ